MNDIEAYKQYLLDRKSSHKTNYYLMSLEELEEIKKEFQGRKPKLLLHACCAVCASWPLEFLSENFELTVFFNNSNIWPEKEYDRRLDELYRYISETNSSINVVTVPYDHETYMEPLNPMKDEPEGWVRCFECYRMRMRQAYQYASDNGFDFFTTVMSISRQKDSQKMNEIGKELSKDFPDVRYFYSDFKKGGGQERQKQLVDEHNLYRQDYCGCEYSYESRHHDE